MDSSVQIRRAAPEDIPAMAALLKDLFSIEADFDFDAGKQERGLGLLLQDPESRCAMVAADSSGRIVGMVTMQFVMSTAEGAPSGWIEDMVVDKSARRRGVGRRLLQAILDWGFANGATRFQLLADKGNAPALEYYKSLGWSGTSLICLRKKA